MATRWKFYSPAIAPDLLLAGGIVVFIAFMGIAAVGFYAVTVSNMIIEQAPARSTIGLGQ